MSTEPCALCPKGWRDSLPCPECNCRMQAFETSPTPSCGTQGLIPCQGCHTECPYNRRAWNIYEAQTSGAWWDGQPFDQPWSPPEGSPPRKDAPAVALVPSDPESDPLSGLNADQRAAASHMEGPMVVTAGAGSGKTTALTARIAHLISKGVPPWRILAVTFTRKAALEMKGRVTESVGEERGKEVKLRTFHSLCLELARGNPSAVGRRRRFSVWDDTVMRQQVRSLVREAREARPGTPSRKQEYAPVELLGYLTTHKEESHPFSLTGPACLGTLRLRDQIRLKHAPHGEEAWEVLCNYERIKELTNSLDFSDLVWAIVQGAQADTEFAAQLANRWDYVMVDEYQDTNRLQVDLLKLLAPHDNLVVVGDDDQAIYGWRGAKVEYILRFEEAHPGAKVVHLGQNYRCTPPIVDSAASVIANNKDRRDKELWSEREGQMAVEVLQTSDLYREANTIAQAAAASIEGGLSPSDLAVLVRTRRQLHLLSSSFAQHQVPVRVVGITEWWQREDSRLICAWAKATINPRDLDAGSYLLQRWPRMGMTRVKTWHDQAIGHDGDMLGEPIQWLYITRGMGRHTKAGKSLERLETLAGWMKEACRQATPIAKIIEHLYEATGIDEDLELCQNSSVPKAVEEGDLRALHRKTMLGVASRIVKTGYDGLEDLLDQVVLAAKAMDAAPDAVTVSTIHAAKGLEWDSVWVAGSVNGLLPLGVVPLGLQQGGTEINEERLEEERRLMYVAMTRAKNRLVLTCPLRLKGRDGADISTTPSCFIEEAKTRGFLCQTTR